MKGFFDGPWRMISMSLNGVFDKFLHTVHLDVVGESSRLRVAMARSNDMRQSDKHVKLF